MSDMQTSESYKERNSNNLDISAVFNNRKIAIWGIGGTVRGVIKKYPWIMDIVDIFIDNNPQVDYFGGVSVYTFDEVTDFNSYFVVIASLYWPDIMKQLQKIGMKQWEDFVIYNDIDKYLKSKLDNQTDCDELKSYLIDYEYQGTIEEIAHKIADNSIKTVSFKVEGILLPTIKNGCGELIGRKNGFSNYLGIKKLATYKAQTENEKSDIDDHYKSINTLFKIDDSEVDRLKEEELALVSKVLIGMSKNNLNLLTIAQKYKKKITLITYMKYKVNFILDILNKIGINTENISCYRRCDFDSYDNFIDAAITTREGHIHITNVIDEKFYLINRNVATYLVPSAADRGAKIPVIKDNWHTRMLNDNCLLYTFLEEKMFDNPFKRYKNNSLFGGDYINLIYIVFVPFFIKFFLWLIQYVETNNYDTLVLTYRDGYLIDEMMRIYQKYKKVKFKVKDIYLSRYLRYCGECLEQNPLLSALSFLGIPNSMTIEDFVENRLLASGGEKEDILRIIEEKTGKTKEMYVEQYVSLVNAYDEMEAVFKKHAQIKFDRVKRYVEGIISRDEKTLVFDVGYRGSVVDFLYTKMGIRTEGIHVLKRGNQDKGTYGYRHTISMIEYSGRYTDEKSLISQTLEDILCSEEGTAVDIDVNGNVIKNDNESKPQIKMVQQYILKTFDDFMSIFSEYIDIMNFDANVEFEIFRDFLLNPSYEDAKLLGTNAFDDSKFLKGNYKDDAYEKWFNKRF